jgi:oligopeptide transport system permease protein
VLFSHPVEHGGLNVGAWLLRRLLLAPVVLLVLATLTFAMVRAAPGGPFQSERGLDPTVQAALAAQYHLDRPLWRQYLDYLGDLAQGDLGPSYKHKAETVNEIVARELPVSLLLGGLALLLALGLGIPAGVLAAARPAGAGDHLAMVAALVAISLPTFVIGPLLAFGFGLWLGWLPVAGWGGWSAPAFLVLPVLTLALPFAARIARLVRAGVLEVANQDFVRTARAKGLDGSAVLMRHALRVGLLPLAGFLGPAAAGLLTGSVVVEQVFQIPGLGREFVEAAVNRDYTLVMGTVLVYGAILVLCNLAADLLAGFLDPRARQA